jgi:hypothetical protein
VLACTRACVRTYVRVCVCVCARLRAVRVTMLDCVCPSVSEEAVSRSVRGQQQNETERIAHKQRMQTAVVIRRTLSRAVVGSVTHTGTPAGGSHKQSPVVTLAYIFFCDSGSRISTCQSKNNNKNTAKRERKKEKTSL